MHIFFCWGESELKLSIFVSIYYAHELEEVNLESLLEPDIVLFACRGLFS